MKALVTPNIERLVPYSPGKPVEEVERELGISGSVKLASNENPLGPSPKAMQAVCSHKSHISRYPDGGGYYLKKRLGEHLDVETDRLVIGNGSNDVLELFARTYLGPGEHAVMSEAAFIIYKLVCLALDRPFTEVPMKGWDTDLDAMAAAVRPETKIVFLANPNNPTGSYVAKEALHRFAAQLPEEVILILDEAYLEYATAPDYPNGLSLLTEHPNTVVCRTFSKIYGLAGLRCGYAVAPARLVDYVNRIRQPFNSSSVAQVAAMAALDDASFVDRSRQMNAEEKIFLQHELSSLGVEVVPSQGNFLLVQFQHSGRELFEDLLKQGVIVRPMDRPYRLDRCLRITIGTRQENVRLLNALSVVLGAKAADRPSPPPHAG